MGVFDIFHDVFHLTVEDRTENVNRMCADAFVSFEPSDLCRADVVLFDQRVLRDVLVFHGFP